MLTGVFLSLLLRDLNSLEGWEGLFLIWRSECAKQSFYKMETLGNLCHTEGNSVFLLIYCFKQRPCHLHHLGRVAELVAFGGNGRKRLININCKCILRIIILSTKGGSYWQDDFARHCNDILANGSELAIKLVKCYLYTFGGKTVQS